MPQLGKQVRHLSIVGNYSGDHTDCMLTNAASKHATNASVKLLKAYTCVVSLVCVSYALGDSGGSAISVVTRGPRGHECRQSEQLTTVTSIT